MKKAFFILTYILFLFEVVLSQEVSKIKLYVGHATFARDVSLVNNSGNVLIKSVGYDIITINSDRRFGLLNIDPSMSIFASKVYSVNNKDLSLVKLDSWDAYGYANNTLALAAVNEPIYGL